MNITHEGMVKLIVETLDATDGAGSDLVTGWRNGAWLHVDGNLDVHHLASDVLAATEPRTITTVEEVDALPNGSVVLDRNGLSLHRGVLGNWNCSNGTRGVRHDEMDTDMFPATVLYEPTA